MLRIARRSAVAARQDLAVSEQAFRHQRRSACDRRCERVRRFLFQLGAVGEMTANALDVIEHVKAWGRSAILSDGDVVFQPRKVDCSGLYHAVEGNVMIYVHKEQELADVEQRYPADHYVLVDDKLRILTAVKQIWGARVTTVFVRQGHYALDPKIVSEYPAADRTVERIGDLLKLDLRLGVNW